MMTPPVVLADDLAADRGDHRVLKNISLSLAPGERMLIRGPSGAGKTTLFHLLGLLDHPTDGTIQINGTDTTTLSERKRATLRRDAIGLVYQEFRLVPELTAEQNATLPHHHTNDHDPGWIDELFTRLGLPPVADQYPAALSGGEKQRVAVARALANKPDLILADEPTGQLDADNTATVMDLLLGLQASENCALLVVSHDAHLTDYFDSIHHLQDGTLTQTPPK